MGKKNIPDLHYEQILLSEISEEEARKILAESGSKEKIEQLKESNAEILFNHPPHKIVEQINARLKMKKKSFISDLIPKKLIAQIASAAAALAIITIAIINPASPGDSSGDGNNIKGLTPKLQVFRDESDGPNSVFRLLEDGATVHENDLIQLSYRPAGQPFGIIFSIDGTGAVNPYYPRYFSDLANELGKGGTVNLDFSLRLDDAPLFEKFYFITSEEEFSPAEVEMIAENFAAEPSRVISGDLPLPSNFEQYSITFYKEGK